MIARNEGVVRDALTSFQH